MRSLLLVVFSSLVLGARSDGVEVAEAIPRECGQMVLVTTRDWTEPRGELRRYARERGGSWRVVGKPQAVLLGERGLAWGVGLHAVSAGPAPRKREGDRRAPAGVFALPGAFGTEARRLRLPYRVVVPGLEAIDDPGSRYYNRIVERGAVSRPDWRSAERMAELPDYRLGIVVAHNPGNVPGAGSCIFIHLWLGARKGTAGCTVLRAKVLEELAEWLDARRHPVLVQLPRGEVPPGFP